MAARQQKEAEVATRRRAREAVASQAAELAREMEDIRRWLAETTARYRVTVADGEALGASAEEIRTLIYELGEFRAGEKAEKASEVRALSDRRAAISADLRSLPTSRSSSRVLHALVSRGSSVTAAIALTSGGDLMPGRSTKQDGQSATVQTLAAEWAAMDAAERAYEDALLEREASLSSEREQAAEARAAAEALQAELAELLR